MTTLERLQQNPAIDYIFVTLHTPIFPNGGHSNDMWYGGNNEYRAVVVGRPVAHKVIAVLIGDEHNYCRMQLSKKIQIYPSNWNKPKITAQP